VSTVGPPRSLAERQAFSERCRATDRGHAQLSPAERTAFVLRHFEGLGVEEIARVLGIESAPRAQHLPAYEAAPRPGAAGRSRPMIT